MNGLGFDPLKLAAVLIVGAGAFLLIFRGQETAGVGLLGGILGYVFGNAHGLVIAMEANKRSLATITPAAPPKR